MLISSFKKCGKENEVELFEKTYKIMLPEQYKRFLIKYNGGETPETTFKIKKVNSDIRAFFGFGDITYSFSEKVKIEDWSVKDIIPIACDSWGNYIAIGINGEKNRKIYFCDHEKYFKETLLTENFKEFINHCKSQKLNEYYTMSIEERKQKLINNGKANNISEDLIKMWQDIINKYAHIKQEEVIID